MTKHAVQQERRHFGRRQSRLNGTIHVRGNIRRTCVVQNFSASGARIVLDEAYRLPKKFELTVDRTGLRVQCEIIHRDGLSYGVQFRIEADESTASTASRPVILTYDQLLALATADREGEEFDNRYGHVLMKPETSAKRPQIRR